MNFTKQTITTATKAMAFIDELAQHDLLFHFDDDAADCLAAHDLSDDTLEAIQHNVDQLPHVDWTNSGYECQFDYLIAKHN